MSISVSCEECGERISKSHYVPSLRILKFECSKGHRGAIENFVLDIV